MTFFLDFIGCGGNGSRLANKIIPTINTRKDCYVRFVDGDIVSPQNIERQDYTIKELQEPKCKILANRYGYYYNFSSNIDYYNTYINEQNIEKLYSGLTFKKYIFLVVFLCVDNIMSRKVYFDYFQNYKTINYLIIDLGNQINYGQIISYSYSTKSSEMIGTSPEIIYPNFNNLNYDDSPDINTSCSDVPAEKQAQTLFANDITSLLAYKNFIDFYKNNYFHGLIQWELKEKEDDRDTLKIEYNNKITPDF